MMESKTTIESNGNEVSNREDELKKLKKERLIIKQESEELARKVAAHSVKRK